MLSLNCCILFFNICTNSNSIHLKNWKYEVLDNNFFFFLNPSTNTGIRCYNNHVERVCNINFSFKKNLESNRNTHDLIIYILASGEYYQQKHNLSLKMKLKNFIQSELLSILQCRFYRPPPPTHPPNEFDSILLTTDNSVNS